jgi:hypothetical protein
MSTVPGQVVGPGAGEHVAGHTGPGQRGGELAHVDVHAPAVPGAGLGQGRGVQGKDSQSPHASTILPGGRRSAWLRSRGTSRRGGAHRPPRRSPTAAARRRPGAGARGAGALGTSGPSASPAARDPGRDRPGCCSRAGRRGRCATSPGAAPRSDGGRRRCGGTGRCRRRASRGCRPGRRASPRRCAAPWRSAGGSRPTAGAGPARSG